jgi:hypothetical protein
MKFISYLLPVLIVFELIGCKKQINNTDVESYIDQLKTNSYDSPELPAFSPTDIPALLKYRNETMIITDFPHNGISSLWAPECKLGMYVLWTIESIRAVEINSEYLVGRFPSQNPIFALRVSEELELVYDEKAHLEAAKAYNDWWASLHILTDKMKIDPLNGTDYRWH